MKNKLLVIIGPTATGKSDIAIKLAQEFNGEIISADSRQIYKGLDIGSGKVTKSEQKLIKHHLLDIVSPKKQFSVAEYQNLVYKKLKQI
jgi:tRNA dimethylallyltransferase